jgi:hypothetical protein
MSSNFRTVVLSKEMSGIQSNKIKKLMNAKD